MADDGKSGLSKAASTDQSTWQMFREINLEFLGHWMFTWFFFCCQHHSGDRLPFCPHGVHGAATVSGYATPEGAYQVAETFGVPLAVLVGAGLPGWKSQNTY